MKTYASPSEESAPSPQVEAPETQVGSPWGNAATAEELTAPESADGWLDEADTHGSESVLYPTEDQLEHPPGPENGGFETADGEAFANPELARQIERGNAGAAEYAEDIARTPAPEAGLPQPFPKLLGTPEYYDARHEDHLNRHHGKPPPPHYYLDYGRKYCVRFSEELYPRLSEAGKAWCVATRTNLQLAIEKTLLANPVAFDALESTSEGFHAFAFGTHPNAYLDAGLAELPVMDLILISMTPDLGDLLTPDGLAQIGVVLPEVAPEKIREAIEDQVPFSEDGTMDWMFGDDDEEAA
jgi:hypothetical protein